MPQSLHYFIITILLLGNRTHRRIYIYMSLPLFRRALLPPTGAIPLTGLVRQDIYNVWLSVINLSTITGLPLARSLVRPSSRISLERLYWLGKEAGRLGCYDFPGET